MITLTDLFCGAGGSSTGATMVDGVQVLMAANHWRLAIDTHQANHPSTDHDCADLSQVDPRRYPRTDVLWASPSCTNHSIARGIARQRQAEARRADLLGQLEAGRPLPDDAAMRSRATMWDVVRFAEHHAYRAIIVENVVDAASWVLFPAWRSALVALGYEMRLLSLNSMHAHLGGSPAPQSRDRLYVVLWRRGERAPDLERVIRPRAWCPTCGEWVRAMQAFKNPEARVGKYRQQYVYRCPSVTCRNQVIEPPVMPAASIIDWNDPGERIGDRARPLAHKTLKRIRIGMDRYWGPDAAPGPLHLEAGGNQYDAADPKHPAHGRPGAYYRIWDGTEPLRTQHTSITKGWALPPFITELRGGRSDARPASDPLATVTASGNHHALTTAPASLAHPSATTPTPARNKGRPIDIEDVRFRMLTPSEITTAMAFPRDYVVLGNKSERVKQAGNAVTPPAARDILSAVTQAVTP